MTMYDKLKNLRIQSMKDKNKVSRTAYEGVISYLDLQRGRGVEIDDSFVIGAVKKEIKEYNDSIKQLLDQDKINELNERIKYLVDFLPQQLSEDDLKNEFELYKKKHDGPYKPKEFMDYLNSEGFDGQYDRGFVARLVMGKL